MAGEKPKTTAYGTPIPTTGKTVPKFKRQKQKPKPPKEIPKGYISAPSVTKAYQTKKKARESTSRSKRQAQKPKVYTTTTKTLESGTKITVKTPVKTSTPTPLSSPIGGSTAGTARELQSQVASQQVTTKQQSDAEALAKDVQLQYSATTGGTQTTIVSKGTHGSREGYYLELQDDLKKSPSVSGLEGQLTRAVRSNRNKYPDAGAYKMGVGKYFIFDKEPDPQYAVTVTPAKKKVKTKKQKSKSMRSPLSLSPPDSLKKEYGPRVPANTMKQLAPYARTLDAGAGVIPYVVEEPRSMRPAGPMVTVTEGGKTKKMRLGIFEHKVISDEIIVHGDPLGATIGGGTLPGTIQKQTKKWDPDSPMKEFYQTDYSQEWIEKPLREIETQTGLYFKGTPVGDVRPISAILGYGGEWIEKGIIKPVVAGSTIVGGMGLSLYSRVRYGKGLDKTLSWETRKKMLADIYHGQDALLTLPSTGMSLSLLTSTNILPNTKWSLARSPIPTTMAGTAPTQTIGKIVSHKKVLGGIEVTHSGGLKGFIPKGHPSYAQYTFSSQMKGLAAASVKNVMHATQTGTRYGLFLGGLEYISSEGDMERTKRGFTAGATLGVLAVTYGAVSPSLKKFGSWQPPSMTNMANQKYLEIKSKAGSLLMISKSSPAALKSIPASNPIIAQVTMIDMLRPSHLKMSNIPQEKESSKTIRIAPSLISYSSLSTGSPTTTTNIDRILKTKVKVGIQQTQKQTQKQKNKQERKIGLMQLQAQGVQTPTKTKQRVTPIPILELRHKQIQVPVISQMIGIKTITEIETPEKPPPLIPPIIIRLPELGDRRKRKKRKPRKKVKRGTRYEPTIAGLSFGRIEVKVKTQYTGLEIRGRKKKKKKGDFYSIF